MSDKQQTIEAVEKLSFEQALEELDRIVRALETGEAALEDSVGAYERGVALKSHCEALLKAAQEKIEKITISPDGEVSSEPFASEN